MVSIKKVPCEECRNQKRRCNGNNPCERCGKMNLACVYFKNSTPDDAEYIQIAKEAELLEEVAYLEDQLDELGAAVHDMKRQRRHCSPSVGSGTPSMTSDDTDTSTVSSNEQLVTSSAIVPRRSTTGCPESPVWILEVTKGGLSFKTQVKTHSDLLVHAENLSQVIQLNDIIPSGVLRDVYRAALMDCIGRRLLYKSNKARYKTTLLAIEHLVPWKKENDPFTTVPTMMATVNPSTPTFSTTLSLVTAYIECQHFYHWAIHIPTFDRLFVQPSIDSYSSLKNADQTSPALLAFCSVLCTMDCDHIAKVVPTSLLPSYSHYYFEQARLSLADHFDEISLELVTTYAFMAIYQWYISNQSISTRYCDMAHRMAYLLATMEYNKDTIYNDDIIHFYRTLCYLQDVCAFQQISTTEVIEPDVDLQPLIDKMRRKLPLSYNMGSTPLITRHLIENEPRFLLFHGYRQDLRHMVQQAFRFYDRCASNMHEIIIQVSYHLENELRQWHARLKDDYRFYGLPLFGTLATTDEVYFEKLEQECDTNITSTLMTLTIYDELVNIGLTSLRKRKAIPEDYSFISHMAELWKGDDKIDTVASINLGVSNIEKWQRRINKMNRLKEEIRFDGANEDFVSLIHSSFYANQDNFSFPFMMLILESTLNAVRICQFLQQKRWQGAYCFFDKRIVFSAKTMLHRFLIARDPLGSMVRPYMDSIYEKISVCEDMLQGPLGYFVFENEGYSWS